MSSSPLIPEPVQPPPVPEQMSRTAVGFFGVVALLAGVLVAYLGIWPVFRMREWPTTTCTINYSAVTSSAGENGRMYSIDLEYHYQVGDQQLIGKRYTHGRNSTSWRFTWDALVQRLPPGAQVPCFYDPREPSSVVLNRTLAEDWLLWVVSLVFTGVGIFLLRLVLFGSLTDEPHS